MKLKTKLKIIIGKIALNESKPTKQKTKNAAKQANEAKEILKLHKKTNPKYHKKTTKISDKPKTKKNKQKIKN